MLSLLYINMVVVVEVVVTATWGRKLLKLLGMEKANVVVAALLLRLSFSKDTKVVVVIAR